MKSYEMQNLYVKESSELTQEEKEFCDAVYCIANDNYNRGGDVISECMTPTEIVEKFSDIEAVYNYIGIRHEYENEIKNA